MIDRGKLEKLLSIKNLADNKNGVNPINLVMDRIVTSISMISGWEKVEIIRGNPVVSIKENFDHLLFPANASCRLEPQTTHIDQENVLITQASAIVVGLFKKGVIRSDAIIACPSMLYRRGDFNRFSTGFPHQLDVWKIKKGGPRLKTDDILSVVKRVVGDILPEINFEVSPKKLHYLVNGIKFRFIYKVELLNAVEGGEISPDFFKQFGFDPEVYSGLATGFGLDRLAMMVKDMDDIRLFRATDPRIVQQMQSLEPYKPVSKMPPIVRDISVVVNDSIQEEDICEKIRSIDQKMVDIIEEIRILSVTGANDLPLAARGRLGIKEGQKNVLIKIIFRALDRTLRKEEADLARNVAYLAVHESEIKVLIDAKI